MRLIHYSEKPLGAVRSVSPVGDKNSIGKPEGLWVSVENGDGDGWKDWCECEGFHPECLAVETEIVLFPEARILRIEDAKSLRAFTKTYQRVLDHAWQHRYTPVDWGRVGADCQGIIIAPYIYECRLDDDTFWYYGWDCACGCIWDASAIAEARPIYGKS